MPSAGDAFNVRSTEGFPDTGTILVGTEKMTYTAKTDTSFTIGAKAQDGTSTFAIPQGALYLASGTLAATTNTITINTIGNGPFPESGTLLLTDDSAGTTEQVTYTSISVTTPSGQLPQPSANDTTSTITFNGVSRGVNGTTALATLVDGDPIKLLPEISLVESVEAMGLEQRHTTVSSTINDSVTSVRLLPQKVLKIADLLELEQKL